MPEETKRERSQREPAETDPGPIEEYRFFLAAEIEPQKKVVPDPDPQQQKDDRDKSLAFFLSE